MLAGHHYVAHATVIEQRVRDVTLSDRQGAHTLPHKLVVREKLLSAACLFLFIVLLCHSARKDTLFMPISQINSPKCLMFQEK
jgi:hypothetical protein